MRGSTRPCMGARGGRSHAAVLRTMGTPLMAKIDFPSKDPAPPVEIPPVIPVVTAPAVACVLYSPMDPPTEPCWLNQLVYPAPVTKAVLAPAPTSTAPPAPIIRSPFEVEVTEGSASPPASATVMLSASSDTAPWTTQPTTALRHRAPKVQDHDPVSPGWSTREKLARPIPLDKRVSPA